jgi:hypothetical protein
MAIVTVTDLVLNFAAACRALVPSLDRAGVPWRDEEQNDDWGRVAEPLFESLVLEPCAFQAVGEAGQSRLLMARYGFQPDPACNAWIEVAGDAGGRMIGLSSVSAPFDHVCCEGPAGAVPLGRASFVFVYAAAYGTRGRLKEVDLEAK